MVLEDSCGAATASAEACDENPNCSAAAAARLPKEPRERSFVPDRAFCLFYIASLLRESEEHR